MSVTGMAAVKAYEKVSHAYDANMLTDALTVFRYTMIETQACGFEKLAAAQWQRAHPFRATFAERGFASVAPMVLALRLL